MSVTYLDIEKIDIPDNKRKKILTVAKRMWNYEKQYIKFKYMVQEMDKAIAVGKFNQWAKEHPEAPIYPVAIQSRDTLRNSRNEEWFAIFSTINEVISELYPDIHEKYVMYTHLNTEINEKFSNCLRVPHYKSDILSLFEEISEYIENGRTKELSKEHIEKLKKNFKQAFEILKEAVIEEEIRKNYTARENVKFSGFDELNFREPLSMLSNITFLTNEYLLPLSNKYEPSYQEFYTRFNFIDKYNKMVEFWRDRFIEEVKNNDDELIGNH